MNVPRTLLLLLGFVLLSASLVERFPALDEDRFRLRYERWRAMEGEQRDALRGRWRAFAALPAERKDSLMSRLGALRRLSGRGVRRAELAGRVDPVIVRESLRKVEERARLRVAPSLTTADGLRADVQAETLRRVRTFIDSLTREKTLDLAERERLLALPAGLRIRETLMLRKHIALRLLEAGAGVSELQELEALDPMEVMQELRRKRRELMLLGKAGQFLRLPEELVKRLATALDEGRLDVVVAALRPHLKVLLRDHGVPAETIAETLDRPYADIERSVHRLLSEPARPKDG